MYQDEYVHCTEVGLPHIRLYRNGAMYHELKQEWIHPQSNGQVELQQFEQNNRFRCSYNWLYGFYFKAPWRQHIVPPYRWLGAFNLSAYYVLDNGEVFSMHTCDYLKGSISVDGYLRVLVAYDNGTSSGIGRHRLVALGFIPNPEGKNEVNHIDGNKLNNHVSNLEWTWSYENMHHALVHGLRYSAISDATIHEICRRLEAGERGCDISRELNIARHHVKDIKAGCHMRISKQYNIPRTKHFSKRQSNNPAGRHHGNEVDADIPYTGEL